MGFHGREIGEFAFSAPSVASRSKTTYSTYGTATPTVERRRRKRRCDDVMLSFTCRMSRGDLQGAEQDLYCSQLHDGPMRGALPSGGLPQRGVRGELLRPLQDTLLLQQKLLSNKIHFHMINHKFRLYKKISTVSRFEVGQPACGNGSRVPVVFISSRLKKIFYLSTV